MERAVTGTKGSLQKNYKLMWDVMWVIFTNRLGLAYMYKGKPNHWRWREMAENLKIRPDLWPPRQRRPLGRRCCRRFPSWSIRYPVRLKRHVLGFDIMGIWSKILRFITVGRAWVSCRRFGRDPRMGRYEIWLDFSNPRWPSVGFRPNTVKYLAGWWEGGERERVPERGKGRETDLFIYLFIY